jgi:hypothetical protein
MWLRTGIILILSYHLRLGPQCGLFPSGFRNKILHAFVTKRNYQTNSMDTVLLEKLTVNRLVKKKIQFYGIENSLLCSQEPATTTYPEPDAPNPHLPTLFS